MAQRRYRKNAPWGGRVREYSGRRIDRGVIIVNRTGLMALTDGDWELGGDIAAAPKAPLAPALPHCRANGFDCYCDHTDDGHGAVWPGGCRCLPF